MKLQAQLSAGHRTCRVPHGQPQQPQQPNCLPHTEDFECHTDSHSSQTVCCTQNMSSATRTATAAKLSAAHRTCQVPQGQPQQPNCLLHTEHVKCHTDSHSSHTVRCAIKALYISNDSSAPRLTIASDLNCRLIVIAVSFQNSVVRLYRNLKLC